MRRDLDKIRQLCRDDEAFEQLRAILAESAPPDFVESSPSPTLTARPPDYQAALLWIVARIRDSLDLTTIFQTTATELRQLLGASRVGVFRFDPGSSWQTGQFICDAVADGFSAAIFKPIVDRCFGRQFAPHYRNGRIQAVEDIYNAGLSPCHVQILEQFQVRANLVVPLLRDGELWGLFCIHQCDRPRQWQSWEIELVQQVGSQLDVALMQAELLQQIRTYAERQRCLFRVITTIHHCPDLDTVFRTAVTETRRLLDADRVGIFRFYAYSEWDEGEFVAESVAPGYPSALKTPVKDKCFGGKFAKHYERGQVQALADIHNSGLSNCHVSILSQFQVRANLVVPLLQEGYLWGLLCIHQCDRPRQWHPQDIELAQYVATHLDVALRHADLLNRSQQQSQELANTLDNLKDAQAQLVHSEKMSSLGQLVAGIAHEINNPVNFIYGNLSHLDSYAQGLLDLMARYQACCPERFEREAAEMAEDVDFAFLAEDLPKTLGSIRVGAERIRRIVQSLQRFARSDDSAATPVNLHDGLDNTLMILQHRLRANAQGPEITLVKQYGELPLVTCQVGRINQVFMNVLSNAIEALEEQYQRQSAWDTLPAEGHPRHLMPQHHGKITLITSSEDDRVTIRIIDNGPGMSADVKSRLFDPFFTTKPVGKGTGLGLSISHKIISSHRGSLDYLSTPGRGTECRITLPVH